MKWKNTAIHKCEKQSMSVNFNFEGIFIFMLMVCEKHSQRTYEVLREKIRFGFRLKGYKNMYFMCAPLPFHSSEWSNAGCTLPVCKFIKCAMITGILCLCNFRILPRLHKKKSISSYYISFWFAIYTSHNGLSSLLTTHIFIFSSHYLHISLFYTFWICIYHAK